MSLIQTIASSSFVSNATGSYGSAATPSNISIITPIVQPTIVIPLTTTFTPPATCTENHLSLMPPPGWAIWNNEPVPALNLTSGACYPTEFMQAYRSVSSGIFGSSVVPAMSPLVCPMNYCTVFTGDDNYAVCCPYGYLLAKPTTTMIQNRPGYGGTCYSDFISGMTTTMTAYNTSGATQLQLWVASTSGAQAYAHPIDGFATSVPELRCQNGSLHSQSTSSPLTSIGPTIAQTSVVSNHMRAGSIAGSVVGAIAGFSLLISIVYYLLRRRHSKRSRALEEGQYGTGANFKANATGLHEMRSEDMLEKSGHEIIEKYSEGTDEKSKARGPVELDGEEVKAELEEGKGGK